MLDQEAADTVPIADLARHMASAVDATAKRLAEEIGFLQDETRRIGGLTVKSEARERASALAAVTADHEAALQRLHQIRRQGGLGGLGTPIQTMQGWLAVRAARSALDDAAAAFDAPEVQIRRRGDLARHNQHVAGEHARLPGIHVALEERTSTHTATVRFQQEVAVAIAAALDNGWVSRRFQADFRAMARQVLQGDIAGASTWLAELVFQRRPATATYEQWTEVAREIRTDAYSGHAGMAASGSYNDIASHSVQLAKPLLRDNIMQAVDSFSHPADQWQALSALLLDPRHLKTDALWAVYWAMFQCGQAMANVLFETDSHEDIFNGKFSAHIDRWLSGWAANEVRQFGYPEVASYMGTVDLANKPEETRLGADFGLIIDLHIGGLVCRKVALFQAKKAMKGVANIGSNTAQLPTLAARPQVGFYVFYHRLPHPLFPPAPTVAAADQLADMVRASGRSPDAASLAINITTTGWDWASFVSFGLCASASPYGAAFSDATEALDLLGDGDRANLPRYLYVIAITDAPRVKELRREISQHYHARAAARSHERQRSNEPRRDGPHLERGM